MDLIDIDEFDLLYSEFAGVHCYYFVVFLYFG
jgi:hypothetical protein